MKSLQIMLWIVGATLLALFASIQAWSEIERQRDVAAFVQARQQLAPVSDAIRPQPASAAGTGAPETGTAPATVRPSSRPASADAVLAILSIPGIALEVPMNYGTNEWVLLRGAGLVEGAALPGSKFTRGDSS